MDKLEINKLEINMLPEELLKLIIADLDVRSSINFMVSSKKYLELRNEEIEEKMGLSHKLSKMYESEEDYFKYGKECIKLSSVKYFDVLKYLAEELPERCFIDNYEPKNIVLNVKNNNLFHMFFDYLFKHLDKYCKDEWYEQYCILAVSCNDKLLINKLIEIDVKYLSIILMNYALSKDYNNFVYYYNIHKNICVCECVTVNNKNICYKYPFCDEERNDRFKISGDILVRDGVYQIVNNKCRCGFGTNNYKFHNEYRMMLSAAAVDCREIIKFLLDNGSKEYDDGLFGAIINKNMELAEYFISLGANNHSLAKIIAQERQDPQMFKFIQDKM
jgi:hypothetical protein